MKKAQLLNNVFVVNQNVSMTLPLNNIREVTLSKKADIDFWSTITISRFATICETKPPTINRFCILVGCSGFKEFKFTMQQSEDIDLYDLTKILWRMEKLEKQVDEMKKKSIK